MPVQNGRRMTGQLRTVILVLQIWQTVHQQAPRPLLYGRVDPGRRRMEVGNADISHPKQD